MFLKNSILEIKRRFRRPLGRKIIDILQGNKLRATIHQFFI